jgi:hypothetical protein
METGWINAFGYWHERILVPKSLRPSHSHAPTAGYARMEYNVRAGTESRDGGPTDCRHRAKRSASANGSARRSSCGEGRPLAQSADRPFIEPHLLPSVAYRAGPIALRVRTVRSDARLAQGANPVQSGRSLDQTTARRRRNWQYCDSKKSKIRPATD